MECTTLYLSLLLLLYICSLCWSRTTLNKKQTTKTNQKTNNKKQTKKQTKKISCVSRQAMTFEYPFKCTEWKKQREADGSDAIEKQCRTQTSR